MTNSVHRCTSVTCAKFGRQILAGMAASTKSSNKHEHQQLLSASPASVQTLRTYSRVRRRILPTTGFDKLSRAGGRFREKSCQMWLTLANIDRCRPNMVEIGRMLTELCQNWPLKGRIRRPACEDCSERLREVRFEYVLIKHVWGFGDWHCFSKSKAFRHGRRPPANTLRAT